MRFSITQNPATLDPNVHGLKSGIEIHQQLATKKLFCDCPSMLRDDKPDFTVIRQLRASAGESGETDTAALHETLKKKEFHYQGYQDTTCLVEIDEEPPHPVQPEALHVALQVAKLLNMTLLERVQVMRKTVVDGSNTSGFQRTALLALGGDMDVPNHGRVGIQSLMLEEDAAQIVKRGRTHDVYNLSRLGIPLIEIGTDPDLVTPEMVRDASAYIGMILRSTRKVRRGIGTIRQDVNISVRGGTRVEVKGAQDLKTIPLLVRNEMARQIALIKLHLLLSDVPFTATPVKDVTELFEGNAKGFLKKAIGKGAKSANGTGGAAGTNAVIGVGLKGLRGLLGTELYPKYRVGTELAGYAKAHGFGGIIHADEDEAKYAERGVWNELCNVFNLEPDDTFLLLVGDAQKCRGVIEHILLPRVKRLWEGVPGEVRKPNADATTVYLRPMPGAARMYPETDIPDIEIDARDVEVPKLLSDQIADFAKLYGLPTELAKEAIEEPLFEKLVTDNKKLKPSFIAEALIVYPKEVRKREEKGLEHVLARVLPQILAQHNTGAIPKDAVYELLVEAAHDRPLNFSKYKAVDTKAVEKIVDAVIAADPDAPIKALMGQCMARLRGKADGKLVMELLKKKR